MSQLAAVRSDMDADYQRFTRLQTFLLICSLFVGCLAAGDLPLFACVFLRSLYILYIADYYISSLLVVAAGFVSRSFLWGIRGQDGNALRVSHGGSAPVCRCRCCYRLRLPGCGDGGRVCAGLPVPVLLQAVFAGRRGRGRSRSAPVCRCLGGCRGQVHLVLLPRQGVVKQACYIIRDTEKWRKERKKTIQEVPAVQKSDRGGTGGLLFS